MNIYSERKPIRGVTELKEVLKTKDQLIALVYATWCPFCMRFLPVFEKTAKDDPRFLIVEDNEEEVADIYDIEIIPTVLVFRDGEVVRRLDGIAGLGLSESAWIEFLNNCKINI